MKKSLLYIIYFIISISAHSQSTISLNTKQTTAKKLIACNNINLSPGFSFTATSTSSMELKVDPTTCDIYAGAEASVSKNKIYIRTRTFMNDAGTRYLDAIQYYDNFGRPTENVQRGISPTGADLIALKEYDFLSRDLRSWLPTVVKDNNGAFYNETHLIDKTITAYNDQNPYSLTVYENSSLSRVLEQFGPGQDWHKTYGSDSKAVKTEYMANTAGGILSCAQYSFETGTNMTLTKKGIYAANELYVTKEIGEDNNISYGFKNKQGQIILTRQMDGNSQHDTYYIYDNFGMLKAVLPPAASDILTATNTAWNETTTALKDYAYLYKYDSRNRCIYKKLPGCEPVYCIYDKADRLIFSQDGEQRLKSEWTFAIPDLFGRTVLTGTCKNALDYTKNPLATTLVSGTWAKATNTHKGYNVTGLTLTTPTILTASYYDNYEFMGLNSIPAITDTNFKPETLTGYGTQYTGGNKGQLTGSWTALLDGSTAGIYNVMYYDNRGRVIQTKSNNHLAGGIEKEYIAYNFTGQPTQKQHVHIVTGKTTQTELYTYAYDHAGRLLTTKHKLNAGAEVILAQNTYDDLGRLSSTTANNQANLKATYAYNIRSWTKSITNPLFNQTLYYNESYGGSTKQYNGNISAMGWKTINDNATLGYAFAYDNLSRLTKAAYLGNGAVYTNGYETTYSYDKMGNMKTLTRNGLKAVSSWGPVDNLTMTYTGNQLIKVEDAIANISVSGSMDFKNYSNVSAEYSYNKNGAMTKDLNKGISDIQYNTLNLPRQMDIKSPVAEARNEYTYTATGAKLKVVKKWNPNYSTTPVVGSTINPATLTLSETTDYVGNKTYENGTLKRILTDNGYIEGNIYYFYIKDHLGNNRITAKSDGSLVQATHYYPFGSSFAVGTGATVQPYKYGGKELDVMHGLNQYDFAARQKDDWRFTTIDPLAEEFYSWSPYVYVENNPMRYIDPTGMKKGDPNDPIKLPEVVITPSAPQKGDKVLPAESYGWNLLYLLTGPREYTPSYKPSETSNGLELRYTTFLVNTDGEIIKPKPLLTTGTGPTAAFKGGSLFIKGFKAVDKLQFHRVIKPNILKEAKKIQDFAKTIGKNPDIIVEKGEIILKGVGSYANQTFNTGLKALDYFK